MLKALFATLLLGCSACFAPHISGLATMNNRLILTTGKGDDRQTVYSCDVTPDNKVASCSPMQVNFN